MPVANLNLKEVTYGQLYPVKNNSGQFNSKQVTCGQLFSHKKCQWQILIPNKLNMANYIPLKNASGKL